MKKHKRNEWYQFHFEKQTNQVLPPKKKYVLFLLPETESLPPLVCVGYFRHPAGEKMAVSWVCPGFGRERKMPEHVAWNDCLPKNLLPGKWMDILNGVEDKEHE